jgi:hypothetical protein
VVGLDPRHGGRTPETEGVADAGGLAFVVGAAGPVGLSMVVRELPLATTGSSRSRSGTASYPALARQFHN